MMHLLVPGCVVVVEADVPSMWLEGLLPEEVATLGANVVEKRRREFTAGRNCARRALNALGLPDVPVLLGMHREPLWPIGIVGSITHCANYCAAAVGRCEQVLAIGIDAEIHAPLPLGVEKMVCTEEELRWMRSAPAADRIHWATVIYSAKESLYKAWFPVAQRWLDFDEAEIAIDSQRHSFVVRLLTAVPVTAGCEPISFSGRFEIADEYVLTAIVATASDADMRV